MKPKIEDVAQRAGVSPTTVSRVLNNRGYISEKTKKKVEEAMSALNYVPNDVARSLFNKKSMMIGVIIPTTSNPFFGELAFHLEAKCAEKEYKVLLCNSLNQMDKEEMYVKMLLRNQVDGMIVGTHNRGIEEYKKNNLPIVAIDRYVSDTVPVVGSDNYEGGKMAMSLLLEAGCKKIALIDGEQELETPARERRKAYLEALRRNGMTPYIYEIPEVFSQESHRDIMRKLFEQDPDVDGVFATNDLFAASFIKAAKENGRRIPEDVKVVGYDGTEMIRLALPELTTIRQPIKQIAEEAVELLLKEIEGEFDDLPRETKLPVTLLRNTTV